MNKPIQKATLGMGCFWCSEAIYQQLKGVKKVTSGYAGGDIANPTYEELHSGQTRHAEVIQIEFDANEISYKDILYVFFRIHNPTTLNRQGADVGSEYRSIIFYHDEEQKKIAEAVKKEAQKEYDEIIVTEIVPYTTFYRAESYHQNFYNTKKDSLYCQIVIDPKIQKLKLIAKDHLSG